MDHVDRLEGSEELKQRLRVVLETLTGDLTIADACAELGIGESRFHDLRKLALEGALEAMSPGYTGRPRKDRPSPEQIDEMRQTIRNLELELRKEQAKTEVKQIIGNKKPSMSDEIFKRGAPAAKVRRRSGKKARH
jgi:hypothetical protein